MLLEQVGFSFERIQNSPKHYSEGSGPARGESAHSVRAPGRPNGNEACGRSAVGPGVRPSIQDFPREAAGLQVGGRSLSGLMMARVQ